MPRSSRPYAVPRGATYSTVQPNRPRQRAPTRPSGLRSARAYGTAPYCGTRPLDDENEIHLSELGFAGGGQAATLSRERYRDRPLELERSLITVFDEPMDLEDSYLPEAP